MVSHGNVFTIALAVVALAVVKDDMLHIICMCNSLIPS